MYIRDPRSGSANKCRTILPRDQVPLCPSRLHCCTSPPLSPPLSSTPYPTPTPTAAAVAPHHEQRDLGLPVASPPSLIRGSKDSVPPLSPAPGLAEARRRRQGAPARASPLGARVPRLRAVVGEEVIHSRVIVTGDEVLFSAAAARTRSYARPRWEGRVLSPPLPGSGSSSLHV